MSATFGGDPIEDTYEELPGLPVLFVELVVEWLWLSEWLMAEWGLLFGLQVQDGHGRDSNPSGPVSVIDLRSQCRPVKTGKS